MATAGTGTGFKDKLGRLDRLDKFDDKIRKKFHKSGKIANNYYMPEKY